MHRMTRVPQATEIRAPFEGNEFRFKGDVARLERVRGERVVRLHSATLGEHLYRVTRVIGGRYREDFAGVEVDPVGDALSPLARSSDELILPVSYLIGKGTFRLKGYSVMVGERPGMRAGGVWNRTCIFCHNTVPYLDDLFGVLHGKGAPGYQGEVVDRVLPPERRLQYHVTDAAALVAAVDEEMRFLGASESSAPASSPALANDDRGLDRVDDRGTVSTPVLAVLRRAIDETRARFAAPQLVELGIGCESCHGGAKEHVEDPSAHPTFEPRAAFLQVRAPARRVSPAEWQNRACARCHQVLFSRYPYTWEGGSRRDPAHAGGSHITSGEGRDFLLGGCAGAMTCTACHDPHGADDPVKLARLATPQGNGVCTGCHGGLATSAALRAHAHHEPDGAGAACVGCHMPLKNMGLGYAPTRYHRIGSPTDRARVEGDRPLECALCHTDKTVTALLGDLERMWGKRYDPQALRRLYGDPAANAIVATIDRGYPHEQAAAMGAASAHRDVFALAAIAREQSRNAYPLVRYVAGAALERITGHAASSVGDDGEGDPARPGAPSSPVAPSSRHDDDED
jgi:predicted CXXCH cytochrome family protein